MTDSKDRIERQIDIDANAERVWDLVSRPGWYINDGSIEDVRVERVGDADVVHHPKHGTFPIRTVTLDPPRYAAFRWVPTEGHADLDNSPSTLVEFWVDDRAGGGVTLKVVESGFDSLSGTAEDRRKALDGNTEGWETELLVAKKHLEQA
ncbi:MAG: ATPase [Nocardioidaceae bacterium]